MDDVLTFELVEDTLADPDGDGILPFAIDAETGEITVADADDLDFEALEDEEFDFQVNVSDGTATVVADILVGVDDEPELIAPITANATDVVPLDLGAGLAGELLEFTVTEQDASEPVEVGVFLVDDDGNVIDTEDGTTIVLSAEDLAGDLEGANLAAVLDESAVILSTLDSDPAGESIDSDVLTDLTRTIELADIFGPGELSGANAVFFFIEDGSVNSLIEELGDPEAEEGSGGNFEVTGVGLGLDDNDFQIDAGENLPLVANFVQGDPPVGNSGLQGTDGTELLDFTGLVGDENGEIIGTLNLVESVADFDNLVTFIRVDDENGFVNGLDPTSDADSVAFIDAIFADPTRIAGIDLDGVDGADDGVVGINSDTAGDGSVSIIFEADEIYLPVLIANAGDLTADADTLQQALVDEIASDDPTDGDILAYTGIAGANPDGLDHVRLLGDNVFGFEDLFNTGDADFNDFVVGLDFA